MVRSNLVSISVGYPNLFSIKLTNTQSVDTPSPFQQMLQLPVSELQGYTPILASDFHNVRFVYNGTGIPAWLESISNGVATIWVKLPVSIPANSSITIDMEVDPSLNFDGNYWGENPLLTSTYGQYDNGVNVFPIYYNFAGTTLDSRISTVSGATLTQNNSLSVALTIVGKEYYILTSSFATSPFVMEAYETYYGMSSSINGNEQWAFIIDSNTSTSGIYGGSAYYLAKILNIVEVSPVIFQEGTIIAEGTLNYVSQYTAIDSFTQTPSGLTATFNGTSTSITTTALTSGYIGLYLWSDIPNSNVATVYWLRTRAYPPNGVMPSVEVIA